ncbi:hypothetical protein LP420_36500 [Massilia sp. B-10]|nr:hypothetical protein LP420_36500 [Massilia sp. B-10]
MVTHAVQGNSVTTNIRDYFEKNGTVSITGTAVDTPHSVFMMKGNKNKLYGYLLKYDAKKAYEYTTDDVA